MLYVDEEFYLNIFRGEPVQEADFPALEERAAELIEQKHGEDWVLAVGKGIEQRLG